MALKITRRFLGALLVLAVVVLALVTVGEPQDVTSPTIRETIGVSCWLIWLIAILVTGVVLILGGESVRYGSLASLLLWVAMCLLVWGTVPHHDQGATQHAGGRQVGQRVGRHIGAYDRLPGHRAAQRVVDRGAQHG